MPYFTKKFSFICISGKCAFSLSFFTYRQIPRPNIDLLKSMKPVILSTFLFCLAHLAAAQILNVEKSRLEADTSKRFIGNVNVGFNLNNRGAIAERSITYLGITANSNTAYLSKANMYSLINFFNYISNDGNAFISSGYSHFRINYLHERRLSYENYVQYQYDRPRGLSFRRLVGAGIRYRVTKNDKISVFAGTGIFFEQERWTSSNVEIGVRQADLFKTNNYLSARYEARKNLQFNTIVYYQAGPDNNAGLFRQRVSGELNVNVKITNNIGFATSFTSTYENHPIIPVRKFIFALTHGIAINF